MHRHLSLSYFADSHGNGFDGRGVVWIDGYGDLATLSPPLNNDAAAARSAKLPSARLLAGYLVVVTTFSRCAEQSVKLGRGDVKLEFASSPLLELRWLRLIVDEGARCGAARGWRSIAATRRGAPFNGSFARLCVSPVLFFSPALPKSHSHRHLRRRSPRFLSSTVSYTGHSLGGDAKGAAAAKAAARAAAKARRARNHKRARDAAGSGDGAQGASSVQRKREAAARALARRVEQAKSDAAGFICAIAAERRWVMSGTPTTGADDDLRTSVVSARLRTGLAQVRSYSFLLSVFFPTILTLVLLSFFFYFFSCSA